VPPWWTFHPFEAITEAPTMLTIDDLTYRVAGTDASRQTSVQIGGGWKVGLIGRNGTGKSDLLDLSARASGECGEIVLPAGCAYWFCVRKKRRRQSLATQRRLAADEGARVSCKKSSMRPMGCAQPSCMSNWTRSTRIAAPRAPRVSSPGSASIRRHSFCP